MPVGAGGSSAHSGATESTAAPVTEPQRRGNVKDMTGRRIGHLLVVERAESDRQGQARWRCLCDCGNEPVVLGSHLRKANPTSKCLRHGSDADAAFKNLFSLHKSRAKRKGRVFDFGFKAFLKLIRQPCHYCGAPPSNTHKRLQRRPDYEGVAYNGLDRIDSSEGYAVGNVVTCCAACNRAKSDMTVEEFRDWATRLARWANG